MSWPLRHDFDPSRRSPHSLPDRPLPRVHGWRGTGAFALAESLDVIFANFLASLLAICLWAASIMNGGPYTPPPTVVPACASVRHGDATGGSSLVKTVPSTRDTR